jgi:tRNA dimethylallyltransferase
MTSDSPRLPTRSILIAGPTGVGKSEVAMRLADLRAGEIIAVDSMQVYRGLDIGTAKPSPEDRTRVPHHLLDVAALTESFDAARFATLATAAAWEIDSRGHTPIFCGGTGLYFKTLLEGVGTAPPADPELRAALEKLPIKALLRELENTDPELYRRMDRNNPRRVVRAVEVIRLTGKPYSQQRAEWGAHRGVLDARLFLLRRDPESMRARIDTRVDRMLDQGLVEETRRLLESGLAGNRTALQAIGYRQVAEHLRGDRNRAETAALIKSRTRQFAKRQLTWFKHQAAGIWIEAGPRDDAATVAGRILELCPDVG